MNLSPHFTLKELTHSATALRYGIDNIPSTEEIANLKLLAAEILEPVRMNYGIPFIPSSGFRCSELNRLLGSKDTSQHTKGQAADIEVPCIPNRDLAEWISTFCKFDQIILEFHDPKIPHSGWVHVSVIEKGNRGECLIFDGKSYTKF